jgi:polysaccharide chain length determinant protein (PEP-CTERM system associated)
VLPGRKFTPEEITRIVARRGWLVVLLFAIGLSMAPLLSRFLPELYRSETMIMVIPQRIPDTYVRSTVTAKVEDRLPSISNQILSRSRLERTINDFNLYGAERAGGIMEDIVQRMRADIAVTLEGQDSFRVSYVSSDPRTAQQVTARLASLYIEENLRDRENLAEETNLFLESQLDEAKKRLLEHEQKLEAYRRRYSGQLPSQLGSNLQAIQTFQLQLQSVSESINRARERRLLIERQTADVETLPAITVPAAPGGTGQPNEPATTARQLELVQTQLDLQRLRYTADHPTVRSLERTIRELQAKLEEEAKQPQPVKPKLPSPAELAESARQKRLSDLRAELEVIDRQVASGQAEENRLKRLMADYQVKVEVVPTRESELVELTRDYGTLQAAYASLLTKREDSKIAANLERRQIGEQFRILDPASLPERPYNETQRLTIMVSGAIAGIVIGLLLVGFREYRDSSFRSEEDVVRILTLPVLAVVPAMESHRERRARRARTLAANLAACLALVGSVAVVAAWRLQWLPL